MQKKMNQFKKYYHIEINLQLDKLKDIGIEYTDKDFDDAIPPDKLFELYTTFFPRYSDREKLNYDLFNTGSYKGKKSISVDTSASKNINYTHYIMNENVLIRALGNLQFLIDANMLSYTTSEELLFQCSLSVSNTITGSKLEMVKFIKEATGMGLKESKDIVDAATHNDYKKHAVDFDLTEAEIINFNQKMINRKITTYDFYFDGYMVLRKYKIGNYDTVIKFTYTEFVHHNFISLNYIESIRADIVLHRKYKYADYMKTFYINFASETIIFSYDINKHRNSDFTYDNFLLFLPEFIKLVDKGYDTYLTAAKLFNAYADDKEKRIININDINEQ